MDDFFSQIPAGLWVNCFLIIGGLFGLIIYYAVIRPRWVKKRKPVQEQPAAFVKAASPEPPIYDEPEAPLVDRLAQMPPAPERVAPQPRASTPPPPRREPTAPVIPPAPQPAPHPARQPRSGVPSGVPVKKEGEYVIKLSDGVNAKATEVLSLMRDSADNLLIIHINGVAYRSLSDQPEVKRQFTALMNELARTIAQPAPPRPETDEPDIEEEAFISAPPAAAPPREAWTPPDEDFSDTHLSVDDLRSAAAADDPAADDPYTDYDVLSYEDELLDSPSLDDLLDGPPLDDLLDLDEPAPYVSSGPARSFSSAPPPPLDDGKMPGDISLPSLDDELPKKRGFMGFGRGVDMPPVPELNIGEAIEAYLQHKLSYTPEFRGRKIHVHSAPGGGVRIEVDGQFYDAVGDVRDADVRTFIQTAIQEWQDRQ